MGQKAAPALMLTGESSKHIVQIIQLLEERNLSFSFCLNKADTLTLCGMTLLYQALNVAHESKLMKDSEKYANVVIKMVEKAKAPGSSELRRIAGTLITLDEEPQSSFPAPVRRSLDACMAAPSNRTSPPTSHAPHKKASPTLGRHASASWSETDLLANQEKPRMATMPQLTHTQSELYRARSRHSLDGGRQDHRPARPDHRLSLKHAQAAQVAMIARASPTSSGGVKQNFDYLPLSATPSHSHQSRSPVQNHGLLQPASHRQQQQNGQLHPQRPQKQPGVSSEQWEQILGSLDNGQVNLYDAIYGGPKISLDEPATATPETTWSTTDPWDLSNFNLAEFANDAATAQTALSLSDESLSSADDLASSDVGLGTGGGLEYAGSLLPVATASATSDGFSLDGGLEGLNDGFGLRCHR